MSGAAHTAPGWVSVSVFIDPRRCVWECCCCRRRRRLLIPSAAPPASLQLARPAHNAVIYAAIISSFIRAAKGVTCSFPNEVYAPFAAGRLQCKLFTRIWPGWSNYNAQAHESTREVWNSEAKAGGLPKWTTLSPLHISLQLKLSSEPSLSS
jgi:hypothetical protein